MLVVKGDDIDTLGKAHYRRTVAIVTHLGGGNPRRGVVRLRKDANIKAQFDGGRNHHAS